MAIDLEEQQARRRLENFNQAAIVLFIDTGIDLPGNEIQRVGGEVRRVLFFSSCEKNFSSVNPNVSNLFVKSYVDSGNLEVHRASDF